MRGETRVLIALTLLRLRTSLDDIMAELLHPPQPPALPQIQPPPAFVPLNFMPDAHGPRPRSARPKFAELHPVWPYTVPLAVAEPFTTPDLGHQRTMPSSTEFIDLEDRGRPLLGMDRYIRDPKPNLWLYT
jgi:hypothetical protein